MQSLVFDSIDKENFDYLKVDYQDNYSLDKTIAQTIWSEYSKNTLELYGAPLNKSFPDSFDLRENSSLKYLMKRRDKKITSLKSCMNFMKEDIDMFFDYIDKSILKELSIYYLKNHIKKEVNHLINKNPFSGKSFKSYFLDRYSSLYDLFKANVDNIDLQKQMLIAIDSILFNLIHETKPFDLHYSFDVFVIDGNENFNRMIKQESISDEEKLLLYSTNLKVKKDRKEKLESELKKLNGEISSMEDKAKNDQENAELYFEKTKEAFLSSGKPELLQRLKEYSNDNNDNEDYSLENAFRELFK